MLLAGDVAAGMLVVAAAADVTVVTAGGSLLRSRLYLEVVAGSSSISVLVVSDAVAVAASVDAGEFIMRRRTLKTGRRETLAVVGWRSC